MIDIYIDNRLIDLDNTNISLQKEFEDTVENIPTEIEYSYTISIPATLNNKEIFGFVDTFDVSDKFKRLYNADLYVDEQLILSGKFKITSIESGYYKGNIYNPKKKTVSDILGDKNLNEIIPHLKPMNSLGDFNEINNWVCKLSYGEYSLYYNWGRNEHWSEIGDNHVVFPYVLYGLPMNDFEKLPIDFDIYTQDLAYGTHTITEDKIYPAFNVVSVLKDVFKSEGYNLTGNIIDGNMKDFFGGLYQTFQYSQDDYVKNKDVPFYCHMHGGYRNYIFNKQEDKYTPSPTLEVMDLWDSPQWTCAQGDDIECEGHFQYGVDNPWSAGSGPGGIDYNGFSILEDSKHMFVKSQTDENKGIIIVPKSGWYKIQLSGSVGYPITGDKIITGVKEYTIAGGIKIYEETGEQMVGGCVDEADDTTLKEQPIEIQLKKGSPKDHPALYSFVSFEPGQTVDYQEDYNVAMDNGGDVYLRIPEGEMQRRYPKNGDVLPIKNIGKYSADDFICGARLGGARFGAQWGPAYYGSFQRKNRVYAMGEGLALPDPTKHIRIKRFNNEPTPDPYKTIAPKFDGWFMKMGDYEENSRYEYADKTAFCMVRANDAFTNFKGYNTLTGTEGSYSWDTTSNYGATTWVGADDCTASTNSGIDSKFKGSFNVNTVVWLEQGDTLYLEYLIPYHTGGRYTCCHSQWREQHQWVNAVSSGYDLYVGYLNGNKDWKPKVDDGILSYDDIKTPKLTNVNQFLPQIKCNDYLEKFLKTFNLQLTAKDSKTFSIDTINNGNLMANVIDIDKICNIDDAEFKPLKSESIKEYKWKIDNTETGYVQGNRSPYKAEHGDSVSTSQYYESGYTGEETLVNDANSSGSVKKTEAPWSYNWYKTIHFLHNSLPQPFTENYADISVIADSDIWKDGMTLAAAADEKPKTTKTMRLFTLKKNERLMNTSYSYISFIYDKNTTDTADKGKQMECNLVLPSNYYETFDINGKKHRLHLDYKIMNNTYDGNAYNQSLMDVFFNKNVQGGYDIEVPIKLTNSQYAKTKQGTLYKLHDGLYKVKSIEGHDINLEDDSTLTLTTLR